MDSGQLLKENNEASQQPLTVPPAVKLRLQPLDDALQALVLVLLLLVLLLPLLGRQLQVHGHRVLDGLGSGVHDES